MAKQSTACWRVKAARHVPNAWAGFYFHAERHEGLKEDLQLKLDKRAPVFLDRLPKDMEAELASSICRILAKKIPVTEVPQGAEILNVPKAIP